MKMTFVGCGSAATTPEYWQSNVLLTADSGKHMLIDAGDDARHSVREAGYESSDIDAVYITHLHGDHVHGLEWLAFDTCFNPNLDRPKLYCRGDADTQTGLFYELWEHSQRGALDSLQGKMANITEYFDCHVIGDNESFVWEGITFTPVQSVHIMAGFCIRYSYGLLIEYPKRVVQESINVTDLQAGESIVQGRPYCVFFTSDTQFCPNHIMDFYRKADCIFQDCETSPYKSGVHAHYTELQTLPEDIRKIMWLYHYQPNPTFDAVGDGFAGFVKKGQEFVIDPDTSGE